MIIQSNSTASNSLYSQAAQSPWLTMDAAHTIFTAARRRCYINTPTLNNDDADRQRQVLEAEHDAEWEILDEIEGVVAGKIQADKRQNDGRPWWLPKDMDPVLEEPPKLGLLTEVLHEIEQEIADKPGSFRAYYFAFRFTSAHSPH